jgi:hypothetical protein
VNRRRIDNGLALQPLTYVQFEQNPPCLVTFGGTTRYVDVLGARTWLPNDGERLARTLSQLFPLEVGKRARVVVTADAERSHGSHQWAFTFEVLRRERIQVPAGTYSTFVVRITQQGMFGNSYLEERAVWLDEQNWLPVRTTRRLTRGYGDNQAADWEATSVALPH